MNISSTDCAFFGSFGAAKDFEVTSKFTRKFMSDASESLNTLYAAAMKEDGLSTKGYAEAVSVSTAFAISSAFDYAFEEFVPEEQKTAYNRKKEIFKAEYRKNFDAFFVNNFQKNLKSGFNENNNLASAYAKCMPVALMGALFAALEDAGFTVSIKTT